MKKLLLSALVLLVLSSCTDRLVDFTVISTKNLPIATGSPTNFTKADRRVEGKDVKKIIFAIPIGSPNLKTAIDRAIESYPGAVGLADGVVKSSWWYALLYGESGYIVEGTPILENKETTAQPSPYIQQPTYAQPVQQTQQPAYPQPQQTVTVQQPQQTVIAQPQQTDGLLFLHEVKPGETLDQIAKQYSVTMRDIIKWNQLTSTTLPAGMKLQIQIK